MKNNDLLFKLSEHKGGWFQTMDYALGSHFYMTYLAIHCLEHVNIFSKWKSRPMTWKYNDLLLYFRDQKRDLPASSLNQILASLIGHLSNNDQTRSAQPLLLAAFIWIYC